MDKKKRKFSRHWTKEKLQIESLKYKSRKEFQTNDSGAYSTAGRMKIMDEICSHMIPLMKPKGYWTRERCAIEALKYQTRSEFVEKNQSAYNKSIANNWLNDMCSHMDGVIYSKKGYWTKEKCLEEVLKYDSKTKFHLYSEAAYRSTLNNGWLDEICAHIEKNIKK